MAPFLRSFDFWNAVIFGVLCLVLIGLLIIRDAQKVGQETDEEIDDNNL